MLGEGLVLDGITALDLAKIIVTERQERLGDLDSVMHRELRCLGQIL